MNGRNHPTEKMAELVENELREHVTSLPSYIKDTTDFLNKVTQIAQPLPMILFCFDVVALYPSVPRSPHSNRNRAELAHDTMYSNTNRS